MHMRHNTEYSAGYYRDHLEYYRLLHKKIKSNRVETGRCKICSAPLDPDADCGFISCMNCRGGIKTERCINGNLII